MAVSAAFGIVEACIGVAIEIGKLVRQAVVNKEQSRRLGETVCTTHAIAVIPLYITIFFFSRL